MLFNQWVSNFAGKFSMGETPDKSFGKSSRNMDYKICVLIKHRNPSALSCIKEMLAFGYFGFYNQN